MAREKHYEPEFLAGATIGTTKKKLVVPVSSGTPAGAAQGWVWVDIAGTVSLAYHDGTNAILIPIGGVAVDDTATLNLTLVGGVITGAVLDSPTVAGQTPAQLQTTIVNAITAGVGTAWDTLLEIKAFVEAGDTIASALAITVAGKSRFFAGAVPNGATPQTINHAAALANKNDFILSIKNAAGKEVEYDYTATDGNNISVIDEAGTAIPAGLRYFLITAS